MKYDVGNTVRIKSIDWYEKNKDGEGKVRCKYDFAFIPQMSRLCGKTVKINAIVNHEFYYVDNYTWILTDDMIEGLAKTNKGNTEAKNETGYKVGDRVLIKSIDWYNKNKDAYGRILCNNIMFIDTMTPLCGQVVEIVSTNPNYVGCFNIKESNYMISDGMIECKITEDMDTISKEALAQVLKDAPDKVKEYMYEKFPDIKPKKPVMERIKLFEDALIELGDYHPLVKQYKAINDIGEATDDLGAYIKLRIIITALNEGWEPKFTYNEERFVPVFWLYTQKEVNNMSYEEYNDTSMVLTKDIYETDFAAFVYAGYNFETISSSDSGMPSCLCLKTYELAEYCGKQFIKYWINLKLKRKK